MKSRTIRNMRGFATILLLLAAGSGHAINSESEGFRVNNGNNADINVHNQCRNVGNASGSAHFISTKTYAGWASFLAGTPSGLTLNSCTVDPYWANVVLFIQPTNGDTAIKDISASQKAITIFGETHLTNEISDPWGGNRKVIKFDGANDYLTLEDSPDWFLSNANWTVEFWVYIPTVTASTEMMFMSQASNNSNTALFSLDNATNVGLQHYVLAGGSPALFFSTSGDSPLTGGAWHHVAWVRNGSVVTAYYDGAVEGSESDSSAWADYTGRLAIGRSLIFGVPTFNGYMGAVRITKGVARYTGTFAAPTQPWVATGDTTPDAIAWADFHAESGDQPFTGFNQPVSIEVSAAYVSGTPTIEYGLNGNWSAFAPGSPANFYVTGGDRLAFRVTGAWNTSATITVKNMSSGGTTLDTVTGTVGDPHWSEVVLLIQPTAADSSVSDLSGSAKAVTALNGAGLSTAVSDPFGGSRKVIVFDGVDNRLQLADSADWQYTGDMTMEIWMYAPAVSSSTDYALVEQWLNSNNRAALSLNNSSNAGINIFIRAASTDLINIGTGGTDSQATSGKWHHLAMTKSGTTFRTFLNGVMEGTATDSSPWPDISGSLYIGGGGGSPHLNGYIQGVRITKGTARWTGDFTPPSLPWPNP